MVDNVWEFIRVFKEEKNVARLVLLNVLSGSSVEIYVGGQDAFAEILM